VYKRLSADIWTVARHTMGRVTADTSKKRFIASYSYNKYVKQESEVTRSHMNARESTVVYSSEYLYGTDYA